MPYTHRPAACSAGTSAEKLEATVENVPCSSTTGRASEVQSGSFTPARPTGRSPAGAAGSGVAEVTGLVGVPGVEKSVIDGDPADGADGCSTVEHDAAANATA